MMHLKSQEESTVSCAQSPTLSNNDAFKEGSLYEIDPACLPPIASSQLQSTRVVMVSNKTVSHVPVRFPSVDSVRTYFISGLRMMCPAFSETFVMENELAAKVLRRQISSEEFDEKKILDSFWFDSISIGVFGKMIPTEGNYYLEQNSEGALWVVVGPGKAAKCKEEEEEEEDEVEKGDETHNTDQSLKRKLNCIESVVKVKEDAKEEYGGRSF